MKKLILVAAVAVMTAVSANAQGFEWGAKAGLNGAWVTETYAPMETTGTTEVKNRFGFYAGVFAEQVFTKWLGIQGELLYMQMGDRATILDAHNIAPGTDIGYGDISYGRKFDYIVLPVLAKFYVWKGLSVDIGPQFGYLVSAKHEDKSDWHADDMRNFDLSIVAGLSCKIAGHYDVSVRMNLGQTKIYNVVREAKNCSYSLGVGYRF